MNNLFKQREIAVAVVALTATVMAVPSTVQAADKAKTKSTGTYVSGDFHNHTTCSDGTLSVKKLIDKSAGTFNLDWFVQADHGGSSYRNCTLAEDSLEPIAQVWACRRTVLAQPIRRADNQRVREMGPTSLGKLHCPTGEPTSRAI